MKFIIISTLLDLEKPTITKVRNSSISVTLNCQTRSNPPATYTWLLDGEIVSNSSIISVKNSNITILAAFVCVVKNLIGEYVSSFAEIDYCKFDQFSPFSLLIVMGSTESSLKRAMQPILLYSGQVITFLRKQKYTIVSNKTEIHRVKNIVILLFLTKIMPKRDVE